MHRGTIFIITTNEKNEFEVYKSTEFNGGMGLNHFGRDMYERLKYLKEPLLFDAMIRDFDDRFFKYADEVMIYLADSQENPYINSKGIAIYDYALTNNQFKFFRDDNGYYIYTSDSNYIKNMSDKPVQIVCSNGVYLLEPNQILVSDYNECINNLGETFGEKIDEELQVEKLKVSKYIENQKEKVILNDIIKTFEEFGYKVDLLYENGMVSGYEIETWTDGGVDMIHDITFFDDYENVYSVEAIKKELANLYQSFEVDEEIDVYRQMQDYKKAFTIRQSLEDFEQYDKKLEDLMINFREKYKEIIYKKYMENEIGKEQEI